ADEIPRLGAGPAGRGDAEDTVAPAAGALQEGEEDREQETKGGSAGSPRENAHSGCEVRRQGEADGRPARGREEGTRSVAGELQGGRAGQALHLLGEPSGGDAAPALPDGEVAVLKERWGQGRGAAGESGRVERRQLTGEDGLGAPVVGDVVNGQGERVLAGRLPEEGGTEDRRAGEVEGAADLLPRPPL